MSGDTKRPFHVKLSVAFQLTAEALTWGGLLLFRWPLISKLALRAPMVVFFLILVAIVALGLCLAIYLGENWARIAFAVWWLLGCIALLLSVAIQPSYRHIYFGSGGPVTIVIAGVCLRAVTVFLLFTRASNSWFQRVRASRPAPPPWTCDY